MRQIKLDRIIELHEPGPEIKSDTGSISYGPAIVHTEWAHRIGQPGYTRIAADTLVTELPVQYVIRAEGINAPLLIEEITTKWTVVDTGITYKIESFYESTFGRGQFLILVCVARQ